MQRNMLLKARQLGVNNNVDIWQVIILSEEAYCDNSDDTYNPYLKFVKYKDKYLTATLNAFDFTCRFNNFPSNCQSKKK